MTIFVIHKNFIRPLKSDSPMILILYAILSNSLFILLMLILLFDAFLAYLIWTHYPCGFINVFLICYCCLFFFSLRD